MDRRDSECRLVEGWEPSKFLASMGMLRVKVVPRGYTRL